MGEAETHTPSKRLAPRCTHRPHLLLDTLELKEGSVSVDASEHIPREGEGQVEPERSRRDVGAKPSPSLLPQALVHQRGAQLAPEALSARNTLSSAWLRTRPSGETGDEAALAWGAHSAVVSLSLHHLEVERLGLDVGDTVELRVEALDGGREEIEGGEIGLLGALDLFEFELLLLRQRASLPFSEPCVGELHERGQRLLALAQILDLVEIAPKLELLLCCIALRLEQGSSEDLASSIERHIHEVALDTRGVEEVVDGEGDSAGARCRFDRLDQGGEHVLDLCVGLRAHSGVSGVEGPIERTKTPDQLCVDALVGGEAEEVLAHAPTFEHSVHGDFTGAEVCLGALDEEGSTIAVVDTGEHVEHLGGHHHPAESLRDIEVIDDRLDEVDEHRGAVVRQKVIGIDDVALRFPEALHHVCVLGGREVQGVAPQGALFVLKKEPVDTTKGVGLDQGVEPSEEPFGEVVEDRDIRVGDGAELIDGLEPTGSKGRPIFVAHSEEEVSIKRLRAIARRCGEEQVDPFERVELRPLLELSALLERESALWPSLWRSPCGIAPRDRLGDEPDLGELLALQGDVPVKGVEALGRVRGRRCPEDIFWSGEELFGEGDEIEVSRAHAEEARVAPDVEIKRLGTSSIPAIDGAPAPIVAPSSSPIEEGDHQMNRGAAPQEFSALGVSESAELSGRSFSLDRRDIVEKEDALVFVEGGAGVVVAPHTIVAGATDATKSDRLVSLDVHEGREGAGASP